MTQADTTATVPQPQVVPAFEEERILLRRLGRGDQEAAAQLVDRTYGQVYASLYRLCGGDAELAADLTQESYRRAWDGLKRFDGRSRLGTWLFRIAYNAFLNHVRRPRLVVGFGEETSFDTAPDPGPGHDEVLAQAEAHDRLRRVVLGLPEALRITVAARYWGEVPVREIARLLQISEVAVRKRLRKALRMLENALEAEV